MATREALLPMPDQEHAPTTAAPAVRVGPETLGKANKLPTAVERKVVGQMRKMAVQTALAKSAAAAIAATQDEVQEVIIRQRQASQARFEAVEHLLSDEEKEAWRQMERNAFVAGLNVAKTAAANIARAQEETEVPEASTAYEDWTWRDNVLDTLTFGTHRLRRQGIAPAAGPLAANGLPGRTIVVDIPVANR